MLECSFHIACDKCKNYASYEPTRNAVEAAINARRLGWYTVVIKADTRPGGYSIEALCVNCKGDAGEFRTGDR
jgi:hypothetical protein